MTSREARGDHAWAAGRSLTNEAAIAEARTWLDTLPRSHEATLPASVIGS
ncbi:MAG: hypothetical protein M3464_01070 [Chloroflexota bacterium]|nr:hypothetical protein [Chloroflexota bacterium]